MKWSALAERVHQSLKRTSLLKENDKLLVAVSGGMDSVVLLNVLLELKDHWKWELVVGHVDHGLRPGEDEKESLLCKTLAKSAGLTYLESKIDLNDQAIKEMYAESSTQNPSLESLARNERYAILDKWTNDKKCDIICIGHHLNDQAETVLYRMLTGSGFKGLRGIQSAREKIRRPLMDISKEEIAVYARKEELNYFNDPSNLNESFVRNKIRHKAIPALKRAGFEDIEGMLASSAHSIEEANSALEYYVEIAVKELIVEKKNKLELRYTKFPDYPVYIQKQIIRRLFSENLKIKKHISEKQLDQFLTFITEAETGSSTELLNCNIVKDRQTLDFSKQAGEIDLGEIKIEENTITPLFSLTPLHKNMAYFSHDLYGKDLFLKTWEPGDSMRLFGSGQGKKVSDILKDEKVSALTKAHHPVLLTGGEIIWIPGVKRSNLYTVKPDDKKMIKITYTNMELDNDKKNTDT